MHVTSPYFALESFVEEMSSFFSAGEVGQEIVAAAFLQSAEKLKCCDVQKKVSFYHYFDLKCIKSTKYLFVFAFLNILDFEDSFERRVEVGVEQVDIDSSRTRFGGSVDFDNEWFNFWFLCLLQ